MLTDPLRGRGNRPLRVKMILPALLEATSPGYRPIKYALFPPLGLAGLAGYLDPGDEVELVDEHVQTLDMDDDPDLVLMSVYITTICSETGGPPRHCSPGWRGWAASSRERAPSTRSCRRT